MEYQFKLQHLKCSHCADKIEKKLNKLPFIEEVELNFMLKTLKVTTPIKDKNRIRRKIQETARSIEKEVKVLDEEEEVQAKEAQEKPIQDKMGKQKISAYFLGIGCILAVVAFKKQLEILFIIAYFLISYDIILKAGRNLIRGRMLDENFLMTIATLAAIAIKQYPEAMMVMLFYKVGEYIESRAVNHSRTEITKIMDIRPSFARVMKHLETGYIAKNMPPEEVALGEILEIRPGEQVPLDGKVIKGKSLLDCSVLTGEAMPISVQEGSDVLSGSVNKDGVIFIQVTTLFKESTVSKILKLMQEASSKKSKSEHFITKFARLYTPIVVGSAFFLALVPSFVTGDLSRWINTSIIFLVVSCPCAIVVSVPLGFFAGIGKAAEKKILVKGSNYLEKLNQIDTIVLDKTGTITEGNFAISEVIEKAETKEALLRYAASIEYYSNHPIAQAIVKGYGKTDLFRMKEVQEVSGKGVVGYLDEGVLVVGNSQLMEQHLITIEEVKTIGTPIYVAKDGVFLGSIVLKDAIKAHSKEAILKLKEIGIQKIIMLTGDKRNVAEEVAREVGIDEVHAGLLPEHKVDKVEHLLLKHKVAFVGDGINDAPVLKRADIGIAMGGIGQDAAIEASDIVLMTDELTSIYDAIKIAKETRKSVSQNIGFALGVKSIILVLAILGKGNMWLAVFGDVGVSLLAILNSIRILYSK